MYDVLIRPKSGHCQGSDFSSDTQLDIFWKLDFVLESYWLGDEMVEYEVEGAAREELDRDIKVAGIFGTQPQSLLGEAVFGNLFKGC